MKIDIHNMLGITTKHKVGGVRLSTTFIEFPKKF